MQKFLLATTLILISFTSFSQTPTKNDSLKLDEINKDRIAKNASLDEDDGRTFTKAQIMPKFKNGINALEDSLTNELMKNNFKFKNKEIHLGLRIGKRGQITNLDQLNELKDEDEIKKALSKTSGMWEPGLQNGYLIYALKSIVITMSKKKLTIEEIN